METVKNEKVSKGLLTDLTIGRSGKVGDVLKDVEIDFKLKSEFDLCKSCAGIKDKFSAALDQNVQHIFELKGGTPYRDIP